jgi:uncharacterized membrane protein YfcA
VSVWWALFLAAAGVLAGITGSVGGLASLASYPALLLAGLSPTAANVTNAVALVATTAGSAAGSRPELQGQARFVRRLCVISTLGGIAGAVLLLTTASEVFEVVVPWLIAAGSIVLLVASRLRRAAAEHDESIGPGLQIGVFLIAVYSGYFGAAAGVIMLALLSTASHQSLARVNAAKNLICGASNGVAALVFAISGPVHWLAALALAVGSLIGGRLGPLIVRRLPPGPLRVAIALAGLALAVKLAADAGLF